MREVSTVMLWCGKHHLVRIYYSTSRSRFMSSTSCFYQQDLNAKFFLARAYLNPQSPSCPPWLTGRLQCSCRNFAAYRPTLSPLPRQLTAWDEADFKPLPRHLMAWVIVHVNTYSYNEAVVVCRLHANINPRHYITACQLHSAATSRPIGRR